MKYKKKFNKDKTKVTITAPEGSRGFWNPNKRSWKKKTFIVADKQKIYEKIRKNKRINLKNKYIEGFLLDEYRKNEGMDKEDKVELKNFNAEGAFFDGSFSFLDTVLKGKISLKYAFFDGDVSFEKEQDFIEGINILGYKKEFNKDRTKVTITATGDSRGFSNLNKTDWVKEKTFKVIDRKRVYRWIKNEKSIDLRGKYIEGFSLCEYREKKNLGEYDRINLKKFNSEGAFFDGGVDFSHAGFKGKVDFFGATFQDGKIEFRNLKVQGDWDMRSVQADIVDFSDSIIHGTVDFTRAKIKQLRLINTRLTGKIFISSQELRLGRNIKNQEDAINSQALPRTVVHKKKSDQFRLLKENFHSLGQYEDEDRAYFWFKYHQIRTERKFEKDEPFWKKITKPVIFAYKWLAFERMGKYGTSPRNVMVSMAVVVVLFSLFYLPVVSLENIGLPNDLPLWKIGVINSIYHSVITFLTIGYGHNFIRQTLSGRILSGIEGFLGLFLMAYLTIAFVRKVLR
jgi:uncharacterized protein YjbI with pentapeptide repeats